jgi:predicted lipoprotein with Yx(FWY)xxD motif
MKNLIRLKDSRAVRHGGHPLYRFSLDREPGQTKGAGLQDFGAGWDVLSPAGKKIESGA